MFLRLVAYSEVAVSLSDACFERSLDFGLIIELSFKAFCEVVKHLSNAIVCSCVARMVSRREHLLEISRDFSLRCDGQIRPLLLDQRRGPFPPRANRLPRA